MKRISFLTIVTACAALAAPGISASQTQGALRFTLGDGSNTVRLQGTAGDFVFVIAGLGAPVDTLTGPALGAYAGTLEIVSDRNVGATSPTKVTIAPAFFLGRTNAGALSWTVNIRADALPANSIERRVMSFTLGDGAASDPYSVEYTLTNQAASSESYDILTPGHDWIVSWSAPDVERLYAVTIANKSNPLVRLRPVQLALRQSDGDNSIGLERLRMLPAAGASAVEAVDLSPYETKTIFLRLDPASSTGPFGTFTGSVQFASDGTPVRVMALTAKATSGGIKLLGAFLVLLGLWLSVVVTNFLQPRLARLQALRPAAVLREALLRFADAARAGGNGDLGGIENEARQQASRLEERALDAEGLLPPRIALGTAPATEPATRLKQRLDEISGRLAGLIVLRDAVVQLKARVTGPGPRPRPIDDAIALVNQAAPQVTTAETARAVVTRVLDGLRAAGVAETARDLESSTVTVDEIDFALQHTAGVSWTIWALVSLAIGVTYVYSDVDFGAALDLLGAFLWGFGLTTFGAGLQQLTPSSVATHVGLKVPRT